MFTFCLSIIVIKNFVTVVLVHVVNQIKDFQTLFSSSEFRCLIFSAGHKFLDNLFFEKWLSHEDKKQRDPSLSQYSGYVVSASE